MTDENVPYLDPEKTIENTDYLTQIYNDMSKRFPEELDHAQGRSDMQIACFVGGSEYGMAATYKHLLKNASIMRGELFRTIKEGVEYQREFDMKWAEVEDKTKPIQWPNKDGVLKYHWFDLDSFEQKNYVNALAVGIKDKVQQLTYFDKMLDSLIEKNGGPITKEQFDAEEPEYWRKRLTSQAANDIISAQMGIHGGNLVSIQQAAAPTIIPGSKNKVTNFPTDIKGFIEQAQLNAVQNYLDVSKDFAESVKLENKTEVKPLSNGDDILKQLGIGESNV